MDCQGCLPYLGKPSRVGALGSSRDQSQLQPSDSGTSRARSRGDLREQELHLQPEPAQVSSSFRAGTARDEGVSGDGTAQGCPLCWEGSLEHPLLALGFCAQCGAAKAPSAQRGVQAITAQERGLSWHMEIEARRMCSV